MFTEFCRMFTEFSHACRAGRFYVRGERNIRYHVRYYLIYYINYDIIYDRILGAIIRYFIR
ncbi:hypothetical protein F4054_07695 [Candidatus Poribacteria bacterium]|nr:hypothetical protein [Candidatus Poribacteria bacterium]MYK22128.1 hypothetical protein [Candidatus Poribacteria bacterium]